MSSSSQPLKAAPVTGAGFDPAYVPGITAPVTGTARDAGPEPREEEARAGKTAETAPESPDEASETSEEASETAAEVASETSDAEPSAPTGADEPPVDGPVFEAADRRARIVADHAGVRLSLDDQACEFRWDEIGAVETETARFGKRFTITVHTPDRRWYPIEIEAKSRSDFPAWEAALDKVLDAYFDDGTDGETDPETEAQAQAETA